jgi:O-methyltransferase
MSSRVNITSSWKERIGWMSNAILRPLGAELTSRRSNDHVWESNAEFVRARERVLPYTMMGPQRMFVLWQLARQASALRVDGDTAEIGVWRGGGSYLIADQNRTRKHWALDTFEGLPEADADRLPKGAFANTSAESVRAVLAALGNVEVVKGLFPASAAPLEGRRFAFVHLDMDLHAGTRDGLAFFWPRLVLGGIVVIDDYGTSHEGVTRAVDEFATTPIARPMVFARGQAVLMKTFD